jgi:GWxTD domain-containing protein
MNKRKYIIASLLLLGLSVISAQKLPPPSPFVVNIDISRFRFAPDTGYLEVYYAAYPSNTTLENVRDTLWGSVVLKARILNTKNDSLITSYSISIPIVIANTDSASIKSGYIGKSVYALPIGSYELFIQGYDGRNPTRQDSIRKKFSIENYVGSPMVSDVDLCSRIIQSEDKTNHFYKNMYEVLPNPSLVFGSQIAPVVFSYAEFYNLNPESTYSITIGIMNGKGTLVKQRTRNHRYTSCNVVDVGSLNVGSIQSGKYRFILVLADTLGQEIDRTEKPIYIHNPHLPSEVVASMSSKSAEFVGLSNDELVDEFREARYIASSSDVNTFEKLTTMESRREFLANFWTDVESGRRGRSDFTRSLYLERVITANQRYKALGKKGWLTDRGRVYILYAEPDEVERFPSSENSKSYEIWHYYQIEGGIQFIFIELSGFGDYTLVHSTKRGELQDERWDRYLQ